MNMCIKKIQSDDSFLCVDNIVPLLKEGWLFPGLLQYQEKEAASMEINVKYSIVSCNTKQLEQSWFLTYMII